MSNKRIVTGTVAALTALSVSSAQAVSLGKVGNTSVSMGGYVKFDAMMTSFSDGAVSAQNLTRDFYIPSLTPVGGTDEDVVFDMHAKQSRINFKTVTEDGDDTLTTFFEFDFLASAGGNERITNSYGPRMRHAFLKWNNWLFGQTWTTFQNVGSLPESVDFIGNTDAGIFGRQAQIRYTSGPWMFSAENPETTVSDGGRVVTDDNSLPDFVVRFNQKSDGLSISYAALIRQLAYNNTNGGGAAAAGTIDSTETSVGISITGKMMLGDNDLRFGLNTGSGMGRYIGLNAVNGAVVNGTEIEAIDSTGVFLSYRLVLGEGARINLGFSTLSVDNDDAPLAGAGGLESTTRISANYMKTVAKGLTLGVELSQATRENENGAEGDMTRLQFTAKQGF